MSPLYTTINSNDQLSDFIFHPIGEYDNCPELMTTSDIDLVINDFDSTFRCSSFYTNLIEIN